MVISTRDNERRETATYSRSIVVMSTRTAAVIYGPRNHAHRLIDSKVSARTASYSISYSQHFHKPSSEPNLRRPIEVDEGYTERVARTKRRKSPQWGMVGVDAVRVEFSTFFGTASKGRGIVQAFLVARVVVVGAIIDLALSCIAYTLSALLVRPEKPYHTHVY